MNENPLPPQQPAWPPTHVRRPFPRWALVGGLGIACALLLGLGALIGATLLPALGASAAGADAGHYAQFTQAGPKGAGGHGPGQGPGRALTVSSVTATTISATTRSGAAVTITTTASTTYTRAGKSVDRSAITKGTTIGVQGTRNSDGSITASHVAIILPSYHGTVTGVTGSDITVKDARSGATHVIHTDANTSFTRGSANSSLGAVATNDEISAEGLLNSDGSMQAAAVHILLPHAGGKITAIAGDKSSLTVQNPRDASKTVTIHLSGSTTYTIVAKGTNGPTQTPASVTDLAVGGYIDAVGTKNSDGSLNAETVRILPGAPAGHHGGRHGTPSATPSTSSTTGG